MRCCICGRKLGGKDSKRRAGRPLAGMLCHKCVEQIAKTKSRLETGQLEEGQVDLRYKKFLVDEKNAKENKKGT